MNQKLDSKTSVVCLSQAEIHHQYFLGLQLIVASSVPRDAVFSWMFKLFRKQHEEKFLSSFEKLGLSHLPHAVACAKYHVLSNSIGGVSVEYAEDSDVKAWVRFRYPRWMYAGPVICGIPIEASRGFLYGWYAQNGVSLNNPRLRFVCVSEDMTGQFGLCGYFEECNYDLSDDERLKFSPNERPPPFNTNVQPQPPSAEWSEERLAKANRNYAVEYIRNGIPTLIEVLGREKGIELGKKAALLTGLQYYQTAASAVDGVDGGIEQAAHFLATILQGMGDECTLSFTDTMATVTQRGIRIVRGLETIDKIDVLECWTEIWRGMIKSHRCFMELDWKQDGESLIWTIRNVEASQVGMKVSST